VSKHAIPLNRFYCWRQRLILWIPTEMKVHRRPYWGLSIYKGGL